MDRVTLVSHSEYLKFHLILYKMEIILAALVYTQDYGRDKEKIKKLIYENIYYKT